jgi:hypothetical protein
MLRFEKKIRFTAAEIQEARKLGLDLAGVKSEAEYSNAVIELITTLEHERPALLEKIAKALAERTGKKLPAKLNVA